MHLPLGGVEEALLFSDKFSAGGHARVTELGEDTSRTALSTISIIIQQHVL